MRATFIAKLLFTGCAVQTVGAACEHCEPTQAGTVCGSLHADAKFLASDGWPVIQGNVENRDVVLLLDSGASHNMLYGPKFGLRPGTLWTVDRVCVNEMCVEDVPFTVSDAQILNGAGADDPQVILGVPFLSGMVITFDHARKIHINAEPHVCPGEAIALTPGASGRPHLDITINGEAFPRVLLDTGAARTVLSAEDAEALQPGLRAHEQPTEICTLTQCQHGYLSQVREICVGDVCEQDVEVKYPVWTAVGMSFLGKDRYALAVGKHQLVRCASADPSM